MDDETRRTDPERAGTSRADGLTRRGALALGAATTITALGAGVPGARADGWRGPVTRDSSFDTDWRFTLGDPSGASSAAFDDGSWRTLDLPHDWSIEDRFPAGEQAASLTTDPSLLVYLPTEPPNPTPPTQIGPFDEPDSAGQGSTGYTVGGVGWYRKHFSTASVLGGSGRHAEIRFDGIFHNAQVWLNGVLLGAHPYGYTPVVYDLTPQLSAHGDNVIAVRVDNSGKTSRWYSGSGIYRHTWLTVTESVRVPAFGVTVTTPAVSAQTATAQVVVDAVNLGAAAQRVAARVQVLDGHGRAVARGRSAPASLAAGSTSGSFTVALGVPRPALWSLDAPNLYTAVVELVAGGQVVDEVAQTFGIRTLTWNGTVGFQLNGETVKVCGGCVHDTHGALGAVGLDRTEERRVEQLKAAGFNAIRTAHNPPTPALLDACDRLGMLVWDEFTDMWDVGKNPQDYSVAFDQWWPRDLTAMIQRDRNHPCVVIWSLGNEIPESGDYATLGPQLAALVHSLDPTRPISQGGGMTSGPDDPAWGWCTVGDYHYNADGTGPAPLHAAHPGYALTQSESFPASIYDDWQITLANPWQVGNWTWAAIDYLGESGLGKTPVAAAGTGASVVNQTINPGWRTADTLYKSYDGYGYGYPWFQSNCGDLDLIGERKPQNYWRAAVQGSCPVSMLVERPVPAGQEQEAVWWGYYDEQPSWNWDVPSGQALTVRVYTTGDLVSLTLNGAPIDGVSPVVPSQARAAFSVPFAPGRLQATASKGGAVIGTVTLVTTGSPAGIRLVPDRPRITTSRDDLGFVLVEIVDDQGRLVPDAVVDVNFAVNGAGELAGVANGNPKNLDSFRGTRRFTWHGQAQAIVRPATRPGVASLWASSPGLRSARVSLPVAAGAAGGLGWSRRDVLRAGRRR